MVTTSTLTVGGFIAARGRHVEFAAGQPLFFEGDRSHSVYACVEGRIRVFVTLPSGRELIIGMKEAGEEFGELSAIDERPRSASAIAIERSVVAHLPGERFLDDLQHEPDLAVAMLRSLAAQLRRANARLRARNGDSALVRTGQLLIELSSLKLRHDRQAAHIELPITQADIAEWTGATRESTARALGELRRDGVIDTGRGRIVVRDVAALVSRIESA
ncbi:MAG: Crp/Fnr family transcriptional regulator [Ilumatobacter sp.]|uniref:Crp/Fnr family transcriptional regulator n=1 Tax=Ilumatobacter sp. TaxID=1967498 RepID=UPI0026062114|nr:Crp/Fnr family transcriptional regulator [Ilumatobacter sp.]MDJ0769234.1 Crp/Fnr family transcriptional regulator [Ilumatobacter sp.]